MEIRDTKQEVFIPNVDNKTIQLTYGQLENYLQKRFDTVGISKSGQTFEQYIMQQEIGCCFDQKPNATVTLIPSNNGEIYELAITKNK
jgi:hypothetical protein